MNEKIIVKSQANFSYFLNNVFSLSFEGKFKEGKHLNQWATMIQSSNNICIIAPRKHSKSTMIYANLLWEALRNPNEDIEVLYLSYKQDMARYHLKHLKDVKEKNPIFEQLTDLSRGESICKYTWDNYHKFVIEPEGILSFKRGRHPDIVILDDVLSDPTTMLDLSVIMKINQRVWEDVMSLPKEGGKIRAVGTPQTTEDFIFQLKNKGFTWGMFPAIISDNKKEVLWPEMFPYERLQQIKFEIGDKAFQKEYILTPIYSAEAFFSEEQVNSIIDLNIAPYTNLNSDNPVIAGWDLGKKSHPSHFTIFEIIDNKFIQRFQIFFDNMDYTDQVEKIKHFVERYGINKVYFDNTRGELEGFMERRELKKEIFRPITLGLKSKSTLAVEFEKLVVNDKIRLLDDGRQKRQILNVTNELDSVDTIEGHGDSFWSIALAVGGEVVEKRKIAIMGMPIDLSKFDPSNILGMK